MGDFFGDDTTLEGLTNVDFRYLINDLALIPQNSPPKSAPDVPHRRTDGWNWSSKGGKVHSAAHANLHCNRDDKNTKRT